MNADRSAKCQGVSLLRPTSWGVTWHAPQGVTWFIGMVLAASMMATALAPAAPADANTAVVGTLKTSMVEMLSAESTTVLAPETDATTTVLEPIYDSPVLIAQPIDMGVVHLSTVRQLSMNGSVSGDGSGIDVALIDTGVAPVSGLGADRVLHGPDLSFESSHAQVAYIDTYGHGTHMAGIIAGNRSGHEGVAPGARIVSLKVAGHDGLTTVPQVVAAIDWVVEHKNTDGLNIRVLNLSLGQQGVTTHVGDVLSAAVERAWDAGIFVVVAAGNEGETYNQLDSPAIDPYVMAVGAADSTSHYRRAGYDVPAWSAVGNGLRNPDMVAAGKSVASYRVPGSTVDNAVPSARIGADLFKGSGSSQAAAATSGAAAVILGEFPNMTNDDLKATLKGSADTLKRESALTAGEGLLDAADSMSKPLSDDQSYPNAAGPGTGIITPNGSTWSGGTWSGGTWSGATWSGATWSGGTWSGATWSGATWSGATWSGATWSGGTWSGATWSGATWSGATWSGAT
ncbi:MAG: S8 family serine peptidase, partial [Acidimicrobiales bacterium]